MELHSLKPAKGSVKNVKRIGRGQGSGRGGTSTKGHKGQKSRSGWKSKKGFEGGQMPLQVRLPKRGFKNINRIDYIAMNVARLQEVHERFNITEISEATLHQHGVIKKNDIVKVLGNGEISAKLTVNVSACSNSAKEKIEKAGGTIVVPEKKK